MKKIASVFLFCVLLTGVALADDGHTPGGGKTVPPPCTENCPTSLTKQAPTTSVPEQGDTSSEISYYEYFKEIFLDVFV